MKTKTQTKQIVVETKQILQIVGYSLSLGFILSVFGTWLNRSRSLSNFTAEMTRFYLVVTAVLMLFIAIHLIMNQRYLHHPVHWLTITYQSFQKGKLSPTVTLLILTIISLVFVQLFSWLTNMLEGRLMF